MTADEFVTKWVLDTVKRDYAEDIALVVAHTTLKLEGGENTISYFIPLTDKGRRFAQTFILCGRGFDIWAIEWERMEQFADLREYNLCCLADGKVLYARTPEDVQRFEALKARQAANLADPKLMRAKALEAFAKAKEIFLETFFASKSDSRMGAGYVLDYLAQSVMFSNGGYFRESQTNQLEELSLVEKMPQGFEDLYTAALLEENPEQQREKCRQLLLLVREFLESLEPRGSVRRDGCCFQDLASWYEELSYTWLRVRHYCQKGDAQKAYMWGISLQREINQVCEDFDLEKLELMDSFSPHRLEEFSERADQCEREMRRQIQEGGGVIREYHSFEEFLHEV